MAQAQQLVFELFLQGKLMPFIGEQVPLSEFGRALSAMRDGNAQGKIILYMHD